MSQVRIHRRLKIEELESRISPTVVTIQATDASASETGADSAMFTITRDGTFGDLVVSYSVSGTAINGVDYNALPGSVTIGDGQSSATLLIIPIDDTEYEGLETVIITLSTSGDYTIGIPGSDTATIVDNDVMTVNVEVLDANASEPGLDTAVFAITRNSTIGDLMVNYTMGGTAQSSSDYHPLPGFVLIPAGSTSVDITVTPIDDTMYEGEETVILTISTSGDYVIGPAGVGQVSIWDDDFMTVSIAATEPTAMEGGPVSGTFTVTRNSVIGEIVVNYIVSGTASSSDYIPLAGSLTIGSGSSAGTIVVTPIDDTEPEGPETVIVALTSGLGYLVGAPDTATVTILDNDTIVNIEATDPSAAEAGLDTGVFTIIRTGWTAGELIVYYTVGGTATSGVDYVPLTGSVVFADGQTTITITITPIDDLVHEESETVILTLSTSGSYTVGTAGNATVTIEDDDPVMVSVFATDAIAKEWGPDTGTFTITRNTTAGDLVVYYTLGGTASSGLDYQVLTGSLTIENGSSTGTVVVTPIDDALIEDPETVVLTLTSGDYIIGSPDAATVTIIDNDTPVTITATDPDASESEPDIGVFTVTREGSTVGDLVVYYTAGGTAAAGSDYILLPGSVIIPHGQISATITITPIDDSEYEEIETVIITLSSSDSYTVGPASDATVTIADNDILTVNIEATDANASETGPDTGLFTISRNSTVGNLVVSYTIGGTALYGTDGDYTCTPELSGLVTIEAGATSATITITPIDDNMYEGEETVVITLSTSGDYTIGTAGAATVAIQDDDVVTVSVYATDPNASEAGPDPGIFTVVRNTTIGDLLMSYNMSGTAANGIDYSILSGSITIGEGSSSGTIISTPIDDTLSEETETAVLTLSVGPGYVINPTAGSATIYISDNDNPWPELGFGSAKGGGLSNNAWNSLYPAIAVGTDGNPIVAWSDKSDLSNAYNIFVLRWDGTSWVEMGAGSASGGGISNTTKDSRNPSIAVGTDGNPIVAWQDFSDGDPEIYVRRWDGSSWVELGASASGGGVSNNTSWSSAPCIAVGTDGNPIVAWQDYYRGNYEIYVKYWTGSSWTEYLTGTQGSATRGGISNSPGHSFAPRIVVGTDGNPIVVWQDDSDGNSEIYLRRWDGSSWVALGCSAAGGGISNNTGASTAPTIALGSDGNPIVAWSDWSDLSGQSEIYLRRWDGSAWVEMGTGSASGGGVSKTPCASQQPSLVVGTDGIPILVWSDDSSGNFEIYVYRWNGYFWADMGAGSATGGGISKSPGSSENPVIAIGADGLPVVAWKEGASEQTGNDAEIYVRRYMEVYAQPSVTIAATDSTVSEANGNIGVFTVVRTGDTSGALTVGYLVGGTATKGEDYAALTGMVIIAAGQRAATITIQPYDDTIREGNETVVLTLSISGDYVIGTPSTDTVTIVDDDLKTKIPLYSGVPSVFTDADGSLITILLTGPGMGHYTLTNQQTTGAAIDEIVLLGTTENTKLSITSKGGATPGTSLGVLQIDNAGITSGALGQFVAKDITLAAYGSFTADGYINSVLLGNIEAGARITIQGSLSDFTAGAMGVSAGVAVDGNIQNFKVASVATGAVNSVTGNIANINVFTGNMDGRITAGGTSGIGVISIPKGGMGGIIETPAGGITTLTIGSGNLSGHVACGGTGGIGAISVPKGGMNGSVNALAGGIKSLNIGGGSLVGQVFAGGTAGIGTMKINGGLIGTVGVGLGQFKSLTVSGAITTGTLISAGTAGIGTITVKGNADLTLKSAGRVGTFAMGGTTAAPTTLKGIFDVKVLTSLKAPNANLDGLTIRATDGVGTMSVLGMKAVLVSAGMLGDVSVSKNVAGSLLLAGPDIGADYLFGTGDDDVFTAGAATGNIGAITIGGTMSGTSIAANVGVGLDGKFGTSDDVVLSNSLVGAIKSLTVKGALIGSTNSTQSFGVMAHDTIGSFTLKGVRKNLPWTLEGGNITVRQNVGK